MLESDDVSNITEGKYVYWMSKDEDIPRGHLGEVVEVLDDDEERRVQFPQGRYKIKAEQLDVSELQKGTFVHCTTDDYDFDVIGEVKSLKDAKLIVEIKGAEIEQKPKNLMKCDFQPGMYVFWTRSDDDIPPGHMGTVVGDLNDEGRVKVKFPKGSWRFKPSDMVRGHIQPHSFVQWKKHDDDIATGEIGQVVGELNDEGRVKVEFSKGTWRFRPEELFLHEMQLGAFVFWSKHDDDVPKGDVGQVMGVKVEEGRLSVKFPQGRWSFKANELKMHNVQPGMLVTWTQSDGDIPRGDIGEVVRMKDSKNRFRVMWPQGSWSIKPKELKALPFQRGDRVQWTSADDDIPEGDLGIVMGIAYVEERGERLHVKWSKGRWRMKPTTLKPTNLDAEAVNQLKAAFKRFDKNGDGKLSVEELTSVLGRLGDGGEGGLSDEDCQELFSGLDKDSDGKLTANEFVDYIFGGQVSGSQRKLLGEGFGMDDLVGLDDDDGEEGNDDDPNDNSNGGGGNVIVTPPPAVVIFDPSVHEGIGPETEVSRAEWASAMLCVGVCRQAALESFDSCLAALGQDGNLTMENLSGELNGIGGAPGVEELRDAIGKVKAGTFGTVDLDSPAEESDYERELALKTGIDGLLYYLSVQNKPLDEAAGEVGSAKLSALENKVLGSMDGDALVEAVKAQAQEAPALSALSSWQRAREHCRNEVNAIIEACKSSGEKYTDSSWNPLEDPKPILYVDSEKPGYDCTVGIPDKWIRVKEVRENCQLFKGSERDQFNDVKQGRTGDCYFVGALAATAANRKAFLRQAFVAYDMDVGVFGIMFNKDSHFTYEIVDDVMAGTNSSMRPFKYAASVDPDEMWVSIIEKAFFKHYKCIEMCDGGHGTEAAFSLIGGVTGCYAISDDDFDHPEKYFERITCALKSGEVMTACFQEPSKGKYADMGGGAAGQCGEKGLPYGLHGGHCYSLLRSVEAHGNQLMCFRNPWASGEWNGPWGDSSKEWTDEMKEACGMTKKTDGVFWMAAEDFVQVSKMTGFIRTFGPTWQTIRSYGRFPDERIVARVKHDYQAQDGGEISLKKGEMIEVIETQGYWVTGKLDENRGQGFCRAKDLEMKSASVFKYEFSADAMAEDAPLILCLMRENQKMCREWNKRKEDGMNYKETHYTKGFWFIFDSSGHRVCKGRFHHRSIWQFLKPSSAGPWTVYITCQAGKGKRFSLQGFAPHGSMKIKRCECSYEDFLDACA